MPAIRPGLRIARSAKGLSALRPASAIENRLSDLGEFVDNPGNLKGLYYFPDALEQPAALVVVLHGCTQNASVYDHGSGWSQLADRHGFALLFPEQQRANNPMLCFNWFAGEDVRRGRGEAASIRAMIAKLSELQEIDPDRIFVTGLSAGGAMTSVMLATYPETFAAGAIIAGVAYGCASGVAEAFDCMGGRSRDSAAGLGRKVRAATSHRGAWPRVQIWHGSADQTVVASNSDAIVRQWTELHGLGATAPIEDKVENHVRRAWQDEGGQAVIEQYVVKGMDHGVPIHVGSDEGQSGVAGPHMLDVGLSSTDRIAAFFGIVPAGNEAAGMAPRKAATPKPSKAKAASLPANDPVRDPNREPSNSVQDVIEKALRSAGLMR